jgi:hypothetical protein
VVLSLKNPSTYLLLPHFSSKAFFTSSLAMDPFNALSTAATARMIPPLRETPPAKVTSCMLVASTDLEKVLDTAKEVIEGADAPSATMGGQPATIGGLFTQLEVGQPSPACQSSPAAQGHASHPVRVLSPRPKIGKEQCSVMPMHPSMGVLTPKKITIRRQLVVPSSSSGDDLPLARYDTQIHLNSSGVRICYTLEPTLVLDSPPPNPLSYIVSG